MTEIEKVLRIYNLLDKSDYKNAIKEALIYIKQGAKLPFLYHSVSIAYIATEQFKEALAILKEGENKFPEYVKFYELLGDAYSGLEDPDNAIKYYNLALKNVKKSDKELISALMTSIADMKSLKGQKKEVKKILKEALILDPKNNDAKILLQINNQTSVDMVKMQKNLDVWDEFYKQKVSEFFKKNKIRKFRSESEENKIQLIIYAAIRKEIFPNMETIKELSADGKKEWFKKIKIDFVNNTSETELKNHIQYEKEVNERFSFLPENGIRIAYIAKPALEFEGMPEQKLLDLLAGFSKPNKKDIILLKWAYEIGKKFTELNNYKDNLAEFEKDIIDILRKRLTEVRSTLSWMHILENEMNK